MNTSPTDGMADPLTDLISASNSLEHPADGGGIKRLSALTDEHTDQRIGQLWLDEIRAVCLSRIRRYSPDIYARSARWDESAIEELIQDVVVRLLEKSQLEYILDVAQDLGHAQALLYRQVQLTLLDRRTRTVVDNVFDRAVERLSHEPFSRHAGPPENWTWPNSPRPEVSSTEEARRKLIYRLRLLPKLPAKGVERASPVWSALTLEEALSDACRTLGRLNRSTLGELLGEVLTSISVSGLVTIEGLPDRADHALEPADEVVAVDLIERLLEDLTDDERTVLNGKFNGNPDGDLALQLGLSRPTVDSRKRSATAKVHTHLEGASEAMQNFVLQRLQEALLNAPVKGGN